MRVRAIRVTVGLVTLLLLGHFVRAEGEKPRSLKPVYRLVFTLHIENGAQRESKSYELTLQEREEGRLRVLTEFPRPVPTGEKRDRLETGAKLDAEFEERGEFVILEVEMHYTSLPESSASLPSELPKPAVYEWQCRLEVSVPQGEPTIVTRSDASPVGPRYQLEVLASKVR